MHYKWEKFKELLYVLSSSIAITWIIVFVTIFGVLFNIYSIEAYQIIALLEGLMLVFCNVNKHE